MAFHAKPSSTTGRLWPGMFLCLEIPMTMDGRGESKDEKNDRKEAYGRKKHETNSKEDEKCNKTVLI